MSFSMIDRRRFLQATGAATAASVVAPRLALAGAPTENRFVFILLRGGLDGLHAMAPYADLQYRAQRPTLALAAPGVAQGALKLDGTFGLHPALAPMHALYQSKELILVPASATQYRKRSHFDGQNMLENGSGKPYGLKDGWLNRAIAGMGGANRKMGLALGPSVPLILQGDQRVQTWANTRLPDVSTDFLTRLAQVYKTDAMFAAALADARSAMKPAMGKGDMEFRPGGGQDFRVAAKAAAQLLSRKEGPRIAVMDLGGWDTHFRQEARLKALFADLSSGVTELKTELGAAWAKTVVLVVSEFGRTVAENGSNGTDHGTGGIAFITGGAVKGGRIAGDWPGLSQAARYEGRDVNPVNAYEGFFKAVLVSHLGLTQGFVEDTVFPSSRSIRPVDGLFRTS